MSMGRRVHADKVERLFGKSPVVTLSSIRRIVGKGGYARKLLHELVKSGRLHRLTRGCYTSREDSSLAVFCFQPAYLGLQDALSRHGLWEQETVPVIVTARKARPGIRSVLGNNVLIRRVEKRYYFGIELHEEEGVALPYSDLEKTFLDMLYFRQRLDGELLRQLRGRIDTKKLRSYASRFPERVRRRALSLLKES